MIGFSKLYNNDFKILKTLKQILSQNKLND